MANGFRRGSKVRFEWSNGTAHGVVAERFDRRVQRTIKGAKVVRNGTTDNPAYLVKTMDGDEALKRGSELRVG
jgi:hypothetical protein